MVNRPKVLIVDDNSTTRKILYDILHPDYDVVQAENGMEAFDIVVRESGELNAIILDLVMPVMDGYQLLEKLHSVAGLSSIPVIVATAEMGVETEKKALKLGAWDFVSKPYDAEILLFRLKNSIERSNMAAYKQLKYLAEYDVLTGIYNKDRMFKDTKNMLLTNRDKTFAFVRYDVDRFKLVNSFYGEKEGNDLLKYMAKTLRKLLSFYDTVSFGRIASDIFCFCLPYEKTHLEELLHTLRHNLEAYNNSYDIVPTFGIYIVEDTNLDVSKIYDYATLAARKAKGNYVDYYAYYTKEMSEKIETEQEIINEMVSALSSNQFDVYMQPKYNIINNTLCGAEALVRWIHPTKGIIPPGEFTPLFEKNGFITKLDFYVWEKVCATIRRWLDEGRSVCPVSVNVSRVDVYNPNFADIIIGLVEKYNIPVGLFNLELTESAYTDNPVAMKETMAKLRNYGFVILMDDFGSGYSSLNVLKDIYFDILKIDMNFLTESSTKGRGENIVASVIRMAKWLKIPVIVEGVETYDQVKFLKSIGCEYVQGFYYARPMSIENYESLTEENLKVKSFDKINPVLDLFDVDSMFDSNPQTEFVFSSIAQAIAIYEYDGSKIDIVRVNEGYYDLMHQDTAVVEFDNVIKSISDDSKSSFLEAFRTVCDNKGKAECEYAVLMPGKHQMWIHLRLKYIHELSGRYLVMGILEDITTQKEVDIELAKYKEALKENKNNIARMLIVDDVSVDRQMLKDIFEDVYEIYEASNGKEAIDIVAKENIDVILLDLIMPSMDGRQFLEYRKNNSNIMSVPVVIITADDRPEEQVATLEYGVSDYIVKPFVPEVIVKRVENVMSAHKRMREIIRKYSGFTRLARIDQMTEVYNRMTTIHLVNDILNADTNASHALVMIDVDDFKLINDTYGHIAGDSVINNIADIVKVSFRSNDVIGRMGGDEFVVLMYGVSDPEIARKKCIFVRDRILSEVSVADKKVSCSFGIAMAPECGNTFEKLYECADRALYKAKESGKNECCIYE